MSDGPQPQQSWSVRGLALVCGTALVLTGCSDAPNEVANIVPDPPLSGFVSVECNGAKAGGWATDVDVSHGMRSYVITTFTAVQSCSYEEEGNTTDPDTLLRNHVNTVMVRSGSKLLEGYVWSWDTANDLAAIMLREKLERLEDAPPPSVGDRVAVLRSPGAPGEERVWGRLKRADREALVTTSELEREDAGWPLLDAEGRVVGVIVADDQRARVFAAPLPLLCRQLVDCSDTPAANWPDWP